VVNPVYLLDVVPDKFKKVLYLKVDTARVMTLYLLFCEAEYPAASCVGSRNVAKPDPKGKFP
jgi:hypothetical protein